MLINCPECQNQISDQSEKCIHCGYPVTLNKDVQKNICIIDGIQYDLSVELELITKTDFMQGLRNLRDKYNLDLANATTLGNIIKNTKLIPPNYDSSQREKYRVEINNIEKQESNTPKCPTCGSTNIQVVTRKWSLLTGFMTNKVDRVCINCKHKF